MKRYRYIIALVSIITCSNFVVAQSPQPEFANFCEDSVFYLYNIGRGAFFASGNDYWTRASLSESRANQVAFHQQLDANGQWDGRSYRIVNWPARDFNHALHLFIETDSKVFTDQNIGNADLDKYFIVTPSSTSEKRYHIGISELNTEFAPATLLDNYYLGIETNSNLSVLELLKANRDSVQTEWAFVTPAAYERYQQQLAEIRFGNVFECSPGTDFTSRIINPDFEQTDYNNVGWVFTFGNITDRNQQASYAKSLTGNNRFGQSTQLSFQFWQTVRNIPNGIYKVDVQAFIRPRGPHMSDIYRTDTTSIKAELFAGNMALPIMNLMDAEIEDKDGQADFLKSDASMYYQTISGGYVPNNVKAAELAFDRGLFNQSLYVEVTDGQLTLGIRQVNARKGTWTAWDNFHLTFIGNDDAARNVMSHEQDSLAYQSIEKPVPMLMPTDELLFDPSQTPSASREMHAQRMATSLNNFAYNAKEKGDLDAAISIIDRAIRLQPQEAKYFDSKGEFLFLKGDTKGARELWNQVLDINPFFLAQHGTTELYRLLNGSSLVEEGDDDVIYEVVDSNAEFPGGESACKRWLSEHLKYPAIALEQRIQGRVDVQFIVNKDGLVSDIEIINSPERFLGKEVERVVAMMPKWKPAYHEGQAVSSRFNFSVMFSLKRRGSQSIVSEMDSIPAFVTVIDYINRKSSPHRSITGRQVEYHQVDLSNAAEHDAEISHSLTIGMIIEEKSDSNLFAQIDEIAYYTNEDPSCHQWILDNLTFPEKAMRKGKHGTVNVGFTVSADGAVTNVKVLSSPHKLLSKEAKRVVEAMPKWKPSYSDGQPVSSRFTVEITFEIE